MLSIRLTIYSLNRPNAKEALDKLSFRAKREIWLAQTLCYRMFDKIPPEGRNDKLIIQRFPKTT